LFASHAVGQVFPGRSLMSKSRNSLNMVNTVNRRQQSLVRAILNTSSATADSEDDKDSSDNSSPDVSMGWVGKILTFLFVFLFDLRAICFV
jgi:hypothetical protein